MLNWKEMKLFHFPVINTNNIFNRLYFRRETTLIFPYQRSLLLCINANISSMINIAVNMMYAIYYFTMTVYTVHMYMLMSWV